MDRFGDSVELSRQRDVVHYEAAKQPTIQDSHEYLLSAYEELSVAEEELRAQHQLILEAQRMLEVQRNRYRTLFDSAPDPYLVTGETGIVEEANDAAAELFSVPAAFLVGRSLAN